MLDKGWHAFGIPGIVHSDMGPQFVGQWWQTMCARMGILRTHIPPNRPRANGRAERAGQQLLSLLRKLHVEHNLNWVEALPRALRLHHDVVGEAGLSPYHIMFGRNRNTQGIVYTPSRSCENSHQFFQRMEQIDKKVAEELNRIHLANATRRNLHKPQRKKFKVGELVWQLKPQSMAVKIRYCPGGKVLCRLSPRLAPIHIWHKTNWGIAFQSILISSSLMWPLVTQTNWLA